MFNELCLKAVEGCGCLLTWWHHQMETFSVLLALCVGNSPVTGEFPSQRPVTYSFDVFFDLRLNKWLSKQLLGWWFETSSCSLWRHCNNLFSVPSVNILDEIKSHCVLTHWGWDKMAAISQTAFSSAFSWMKIYKFGLKFHWNLFLRVQLTIFQP